MTGKRPTLEQVVQEVHDLLQRGQSDHGLEVMTAFDLDDGDSLAAVVAIGERLIADDHLHEAIVVLNSIGDTSPPPNVLVLRGLARLGLAHYQPSAADFEVALHRGIVDDALRRRAVEGVVPALRALAIVRGGCPLYSQKAEMYEQPVAVGFAESDDDLSNEWMTGQWDPGEAFGTVPFGDTLPHALLRFIRVLPDDEEERWCFYEPARIVLATDCGRLDLVNTWESVSYRSQDLIGISRERLESVLGAPDAEEVVLDMVYLSYDGLNVDVVLEGDITTHAVVTGDGPSTE